jgi:hypothetical protein
MCPGRDRTRALTLDPSRIVSQACKPLHQQDNREVSHQHENDNDNEHVIILWVAYVRHRDVIFGPFAGVNEDRLPFPYVPKEHNFVHFLRFVDMFPLEMQYNLII